MTIDRRALLSSAVIASVGMTNTSLAFYNPANHGHDQNEEEEDQQEQGEHEEGEESEHKDQKEGHEHKAGSHKASKKGRHAAPKNTRQVRGSRKALYKSFLAPTKLRPLPFNPNKLNGLSEKLIMSHWKNNYGGSIKALGVIKKSIYQALGNKNTPAFVYNNLKREHLIRTGSVVLHEYYFGGLGGNGRPDKMSSKFIGYAFGSFNVWETEFRRIASGLGGGSGWVVLGYNLHTHQLENYWLADHAHGAATCMPILVMDLYEHAYQMDYGAATARYIDAYFKNINWEVVAMRLEKALSLRA